MNKRYAILYLLAIGLLSTAACGGSGDVEPTPSGTGLNDQINSSVQQTVAAIAVAQTVAALTGSTPPADLPTQELSQPVPTSEVVSSAAAPLSDTPPPPPPTTAAQPTAASASCVVVSGVNLRGGPGTIYDPPVAFAGANTALRPIAYTPVGNPQGAWMQVEVVGAGQTAWVTASSQFVSCTIDPATLPRPAVIPPTPRPPATQTPTPTSQPVANLPPDLRNVSSGATCRDDTAIDAKEPQVDSRFLLRIDAQLFNPPPGESGNGAGIDRVEFLVNEVGYSHTERTAGYCIFQGGEPSCRDWPRNSLGQLTWGAGGPVVVDGSYNISVTIYPKEETQLFECQWNVSFTIDVP